MATPLVERITHPEPELVFAIVGPVGTDQEVFQTCFQNLAEQFRYSVNVLRVSTLMERIHTEKVGVPLDQADFFTRTNSFMSAGNLLRRLAKRGDVMALHAIGQIREKRKKDQEERREPIPRTLHLLRSLKHPEEVEALRRVYGAGFFLIGLQATEKERYAYLTTAKGLTHQQAVDLMQRDRSEDDPFGQQTRETFALSDVFVEATGDRLLPQLGRFLDLVFGHPNITPTRAEHAMYLAYGASMRSAQLARQVGAVVVSSTGEVIGTGANDVPCFGGGLYWPDHPKEKRDHNLGFDSNDLEIDSIIADVIAAVRDSAADVDEAKLLNVLHHSRLDDLTEFGRSVHAEMEALLACARIGVSPVGGKLFTTTFPCHNCAKHIVAAGIKTVYYVEPYPKSKALSLHGDSIGWDDDLSQVGSQRPDVVAFEPFVGVTARRYIDLFSMRLSDGLRMRRKRDGKALPFERSKALPRIRMAPYSYLERELIAHAEIDRAVQEMEQNAGTDPSDLGKG